MAGTSGSGVGGQGVGGGWGGKRGPCSTPYIVNGLSKTAGTGGPGSCLLQDTNAQPMN